MLMFCLIYFRLFICKPGNPTDEIDHEKPVCSRLNEGMAETVMNEDDQHFKFYELIKIAILEQYKLNSFIYKNHTLVCIYNFLNYKNNLETLVKGLESFNHFQNCTIENIKKLRNIPNAINIINSQKQLELRVKEIHKTIKDEMDSFVSEYENNGGLCLLEENQNKDPECQTRYVCIFRNFSVIEKQPEFKSVVEEQGILVESLFVNPRDAP